MRPLRAACGVLLIGLALLLAPFMALGQEVPPPKPETVPFFYDADGMFPDDQLRTLQRDAELLQSSKIPTLVYVRQTSRDNARLETAQAFADQLRREWDIESAAGADDGLVLLVSWVPGDHVVSTVVQSWGTATFEESGLSPQAIQHTIDTSVASLIEQDNPFEVLVYLMRETRYTGIYAPPPVAPLEGSAKALHTVIGWIGPTIAGATAVILGALSPRFWQPKPTGRKVWIAAGAVLGAAALLWTLSVYAQSRAGVASALIMVVLSGLAAWLWTHPPFSTTPGSPVRQIHVPATRRMTRRRHHAKKMLTRATGGIR